MTGRKYILTVAVLATSFGIIPAGAQEDGDFGAGASYQDRYDSYTRPEGPVPGEGLSPKQLWEAYCASQYGSWEETHSESDQWADHKRFNQVDLHLSSEYLIETNDLNPTGTYTSYLNLCWKFQGDEGCGPCPGWFADPPGSIVVVTPPVNVEDEIIPGLIDEVRDRIPDTEPGPLAPPPDAAVVNTPTWLWIESELEVDRVETTVGSALIWADATARPMVEWDMGDDTPPLRCEGPGEEYTGGPLSPGSSCAHSFEKASQSDFTGTVTVTWDIDWGIEMLTPNPPPDDYYGIVDTYDATTDITWNVDEVFSTETG